MKSRIIFALLVLSLPLFAKEVPVEKAKTVAKNFLMLNTAPGLKGSGNINLTQVQFSSTRSFDKRLKKSASADENLIYLFQINENGGYILVSGDDQATPVLGYSLENNMDVSHMPDNFRKWIEDYKSQIRFARAKPEAATREIENQWERLISGKGSEGTKSTSAVEPLITTQWNQSPYYNDLCPYDEDYNERSVTGCVATAMAQIMKYWNYPETGNGFHSYNHSSFGTLSANFGNTTYDWESMTNTVNSENMAVATLMFHCGVSVEMDYSANGSSAYVVTEASAVEHCSEYAFKAYFGYDNSLTGVIRDDNYTTDDWIQLLKTELGSGRPIEYAGFGTGGGHAFVCDGFDANDFFHFNWGWGGYYDGFFALDALDPDATYNSGHQAVIGIKPPVEMTDHELALYDSLTISNDTILWGNPFTIHTDIGNFGETAFSGDYCVAIFDMDNNFVEFAEIIEGKSLEGGFHYESGLSFSNPGSVSLVPAWYLAAAYYRPTGENWKVIGDGDYSNQLYFKVTHSSDMELYKDFVISTGTSITQNEPFTVSADILNDGNSTFHGTFSIDLLSMDIEYAAPVEELSVTGLEPGFFRENLVFSSNGVSIDPGTYLMALFHLPDGGEWTLTGASYYTNPMKVVVMEAPLDPDIYEENDSEENPYMLMLTYTGNNASITTAGSNSHVGDDIDYYGIALEEGYDYTISARTHDSYNSGNQEIYTNDVLWSCYSDKKWSEVYDDVMPGAIEVPGGSEIVFVVVPYFEGETGTYLLDIQVNRSWAASAGIPEENNLKIYPNPADDLIIIEGSEEIERIDFFDAKGRMIVGAEKHSEKITLDVSNLSEGIYFIHITQQDQTTVRKIVKQ
ncbi:MAG: thiol protease/hemagglutinin PrtT [Bacteroidota bacterium]